MSSLLLALTDELRPWLSQLIQDNIKVALAENAGQPRYPEFVAAAQATEITGYSKNSIYQMNHQGRVPGARKIGGKLMFETEALREWVRSGSTPKAD